MLDSFDITEDVGETGLIRDDVYLKVRADILTCTLMPGSLLQEKDLAERYSVGRSPVRDALLRLQEQGLVKVLPRKGYRVLPISLGDAQDLYDMRILLEKECIKRVIDSASDKQIGTLEVFRTARDRIDLAEWVTYNSEFHRSIAGLAGNARLSRAAEEVIDQFDRLTFLSVSEAPQYISSEKLVKEHCEIIDAIKLRNKSLAVRLIGAHVIKSKKRLFAILENPPIVD